MKKHKKNWKSILNVHLWAAKVWWKIDPRLFLSTALYAITNAATPYLTVWLSAKIINALSEKQDAALIWKWVILTLCTTAGLQLIGELLSRWKESVHAMENWHEDKLMADKMMDMDFSAVESPKTNDLRAAMAGFGMGNAYGFIKIHGWYCERLVGGIASILGAIALTVSLFRLRVPESSGIWTVLNSPWVSAGVIFTLLCGTVLSPWLSAQCSATTEKQWPYLNRYSRILNAYCTLHMSTTRCVDVRMYNQQELATQMLSANALYPKGSPACRIRCFQGAPLEVAATAVSVLLIGICYGFVCLKAWAGAFGIGSVTQYVGAVTALCSGISELFRVIGNLPLNANYLYAIREFMEIPNSMYQGSLPTEKRDDREYEVEFRDVSFKYPGSEAYALRHVNMKFKVGSRLAVVGMNGSGKTTFIKLLCRLYDPTEGQILLNGIDIRKYKYNDYINIFSVVFQDFQLVALPLGQNVAASAEYDRARVEQCLRLAGFGDRLDSLPEGLDTYLYKDLEKSGVSISGGEAQKIAIARALYKDAPFIILDEPTAALDPLAEAEIYSKFNEIAGDKTAIYISHRLSSCKFCDEIAVFHEGAVIQQGTHAELVANEQGKYYELWHAQAQYYTENT